MCVHGARVHVCVCARVHVHVSVWGSEICKPLFRARAAEGGGSITPGGILQGPALHCVLLAHVCVVGACGSFRVCGWVCAHKSYTQSA